MEVGRWQASAVLVPNCSQVAVGALDDTGGMHMPVAFQSWVEDEFGLERAFRTRRVRQRQDACKATDGENRGSKRCEGV